jgi:ribosomal-protein-alanine N-acetyltransferase
MIESERLMLIPLTAADLDLYLLGRGKFEKKMKLAAWSRSVTPEIAARVRATILPRMQELKGDDYLYHTFWIVVEKSSRLIVAELGFKGGPSEKGEIEIGYGSFEPFRAKGFMKEAVGGLLRWAAERSEVRRVLAEADPANEASIRILKANGFLPLEPIEGMSRWEWKGKGTSR